MELGEKLRAARLEAGLSQRQLCGDRITRNMLSQIENGTASPSVSTLRFLAGKLGKPVSFFLEEDGSVSPNQAAMEEARRAYDRGCFEDAARSLRAFQEPDPLFQREWELLRLLTTLALAEKALAEHREGYARELLEQAEKLEGRAYCALPELRARRILLLARLSGARPEALAGQLPDMDEPLLLLARGALAEGDGARCAAALDTARNRETPDWKLLRGRAFLLLGAWQEAARCFHAAEAALPRETAPELERCYRELGDYRLAYHYACKARELSDGSSGI